MAERRVVVTEAASGIGAAAWRAPAAARRREGAARAPLEPDAPERPAAETMGGLDVPASDAGFARSHDAIAFLRRAAPHLRAGREPRSVVVSSFVSSAFRADVPVLPAYAAAEEAPARAGAGAGAGGHRLPRPAGRGPRGGTGAARGGGNRGVRAAALLAALLLALAPSGADAQDLAGHGGPVRALAVLPDGGLASAGFDHSVILWDPSAGRARHVTRWHGGAVNALAALPDGGVASGGEDGRVAVWPPGVGAAEPSRVLAGHAAPVAALAVGPGGALASAGWDGTVRAWAEDGSARVLEGHAGPVNGLAWAAAGLVSAGYDGTVRLWDPAGDDGGGRVLAEFGLPQNAVLALPDGTVASAGADGAVRLIALDGTVRELAAGSPPVVALAASPDGVVLAAASLGGSVGLWSVAEARLLRTLEGPGMPVWAAAFATDGRTLWTGGQDRLVRRWDAATGAPLGPLASGADTAAPGGDGHGARVFRACAACHALTPEGGANMAGPHLHGLFGRRMGSLPGYRYSERLARGDVVWTRETVADLFTRGPDVAVPGTTMPVQRVEEAGDLAALLRFLEEAAR